VESSCRGGGKRSGASFGASEAERKMNWSLVVGVVGALTLCFGGVDAQELSVAWNVSLEIVRDGFANVEFGVGSENLRRIEGLRREDGWFSSAQVLVVGGGLSEEEKRKVRFETDAAKLSATYRAEMDDGWVVATKIGEKEVHLVYAFNNSREIIQVQPWHMAQKGMDERQRRELLQRQGEETLHIASWRRHLIANSASCGAKRLDKNGLDMLKSRKSESLTDELTRSQFARHVHTIEEPSSTSEVESEDHSDGMGRRNLRVSNFLFENPPDRWEECHPDEDDLHFLETGIIADAGFVEAFNGSTSTTLRAIEAIVSSANMVYHAQVHVQLRVRQIVLVVGPFAKGTQNETFLSYFEASPSGNFGEFCSADFDCRCNLGGPQLSTCPMDAEPICGIEQPLFAMTAFSQQLSTLPPATLQPVSNSFLFDEKDPSDSFMQLAHWHLLTDCYAAPGIVGIAWALIPESGQPRRGTVCDDSGLNVAVSSRTDDVWATFTHEVGHNFGMQHSFEDGQGQTGGIMDYGRLVVNGKIQFNEKYRRPELCGELTLIENSNVCARSGGSNLFPSDSAPCSNRQNERPENLYCSGGFCPFNEETLELGECQPFPSSLLFDEEYLEFASARIGVEISGYGAAKPLKWRAIGGDDQMCSPSSLLFNEEDVVLVQRGNCDFDVKALNLLRTGAGAMVVYNNVDDELFSPNGILKDIPLKVAMISMEDGMRIRVLIQNREQEGGEPYVGYFGAAPPYILSRAVFTDTAPREGPDPVTITIVAIMTPIGAVLIAAGGIIAYRHSRDTMDDYEREKRAWRHKSKFGRIFRASRKGSLYLNDNPDSTNSDSGRNIVRKGSLFLDDNPSSFSSVGSNEFYDEDDDDDFTTRYSSNNSRTRGGTFDSPIVMRPRGASFESQASARTRGGTLGTPQILDRKPTMTPQKIPDL